MKTQTKFYRLVQGSLVLIVIANSQSLKKKGCRIRPGKFLYDSSRTFGTNRICEQRITKNEGMRMKAQAKNLGPVHEKYLICE